LRATYGDLLTLRDIGIVLRYPSLNAVRKARLAGQLPFVTQLPHRRGWFATPEAVAQFFETLNRHSTSAEKDISTRTKASGTDDPKEE